MVIYANLPELNRAMDFSATLNHETLRALEGNNRVISTMRGFLADGIDQKREAIVYLSASNQLRTIAGLSNEDSLKAWLAAEKYEVKDGWAQTKSGKVFWKDGLIAFTESAIRPENFEAEILINEVPVEEGELLTFLERDAPLRMWSANVAELLNGLDDNAVASIPASSAAILINTQKASFTIDLEMSVSDQSSASAMKSWLQGSTGPIWENILQSGTPLWASATPQVAQLIDILGLGNWSVPGSRRATIWFSGMAISNRGGFGIKPDVSLRIDLEKGVNVTAAQRFVMQRNGSVQGRLNLLGTGADMVAINETLGASTVRDPEEVIAPFEAPAAVPLGIARSLSGSPLQVFISGKDLANATSMRMIEPMSWTAMYLDDGGTDAPEHVDMALHLTGETRDADADGLSTFLDVVLNVYPVITSMMGLAG